MQKLIAILSILSLLAFGQALAEEKKKGKKEDSLSLAALMIKDQHFFRAQSILEKVDIEAEKAKNKDFDIKRYHTLSGITYLNTQQNDKAIPHFQAVLDTGEKNQIFHVYIAQAYYKNADYLNAIKHIDLAPEQKEENANLVLMKFDSYQKLNDKYQAWDTLKEGKNLYPYDDRFPKQMVFSLINLGFYQKAAELGLAFTKEFQPDPEDYIAIGTALAKAGNTQQAGQFLEQAKLHFPNDLVANKALANYYAQNKQFYAAARIMEPIATVETELVTEAAELNKKAEQYVRALFLNARATQQGEKLKQRLALYLESEEYEMAAAMERDLRRSKILEDDNVKYALAYSMFKAGDFKSTERVLGQIRDSRVFKKANVIRSAMADCRDNKWRCM